MRERWKNRIVDLLWQERGEQMMLVAMYAMEWERRAREERPEQMMLAARHAMEQEKRVREERERKVEAEKARLASVLWSVDRARQAV